MEVVSLISRELDKTREVAAKYGIAHVTTELADSLALKEVDAVILCTPTQMHAEHSMACLTAGKHVQVEIPLADSLQGAQDVVAMANTSGLVAMCGHTRRFNPSHQFVHKEIKAGRFNIHPVLGIAMDMSIQLKAANGAICTLSLSFNNDGPLGTFFRYIGDSATYIARYDDLFNGKDEKIDVSKVDVSMNGIELQDREFFAAIREGRAPNSSVASVLPCYQVLHDLEVQLAN